MVVASVGVWITPSRDTRILWLFAGILERLKSVRDPLPTKLSILWSVTSYVGKLFAIIFPQKISVDAGAVANKITLGCSSANPSEGTTAWCGFWRTPFIVIRTCAALVALDFLPLSKVALNFLLNPSN